MQVKKRRRQWCLCVTGRENLRRQEEGDTKTMTLSDVLQQSYVHTQAVRLCVGV